MTEPWVPLSTAAYRNAHLHPDDIDTGVVILTGEALRRENSERIARILSEKCGDLVCAAAGHHMEALLAAHGSQVRYRPPTPAANAC